jgi:hypothetical protein
VLEERTPDARIRAVPNETMLLPGPFASSLGELAQTLLDIGAAAEHRQSPGDTLNPIAA